MRSFTKCAGICVCLVLFYLCFPAQSAETGKSAPVQINYQGLLQNNAGSPLQGTYDMVFRIYNQEIGGPFDWQEVHAVTDAVTTDANGVFNVVLNSTGSATGNLATLLRDSAAVWLEIEVQGEILTPRQRLTSSAYALSAPWSGLTGVPADFSDGTDDIASPGLGLDQAGSLLSLEPSYQLPQTATNGQVAKWNSTNQMWEPANDLTGGTYSAGNGLILTGSQFSVSYGGSGTETSIARSDHDHVAQNWTGSSAPLTITNSSTATGATALHAKTTANTVNSGIIGETESATDGAAGVLGIASGSGRTYGVKGESTSRSPGARGVVGIASGGAFGSAGVYGEAQADNAYGVQGKSLGNDSYGVYSQGNAKVDGNLEVTGTILTNGIYSIPPSAIRPERNSFNYENVNGYYVRIDGAMGLDDNTEAYIPLFLPDGVTLTKITYKGYTESGCGPSTNTDFILKLYRSPFSDSLEIVSSFSDEEFPYVGFNSAFTYETTTFLNPVVDNSNYCYFIVINCNRDIRTYGIQVEYSR